MARVNAGLLVAFAILLLHVFTTEGKPNFSEDGHTAVPFPETNENPKISLVMDDVQKSVLADMFSPDKLAKAKKFGSDTLEDQRVNERQRLPEPKNEWGEGVFPYDDTPLTKMEWSEGVSPDDEVPLVKVNKRLAMMQLREAAFPDDVLLQENEK